MLNAGGRNVDGARLFIWCWLVASLLNGAVGVFAAKILLINEVAAFIPIFGTSGRGGVVPLASDLEPRLPAPTMDFRKFYSAAHRIVQAQMHTMNTRARFKSVRTDRELDSRRTRRCGRPGSRSSRCRTASARRSSIAEVSAADLLLMCYTPVTAP